MRSTLSEFRRRENTFSSKVSKWRGNSLVEMIIYIALLSLFVLLVVDVIVMMSWSYHRLVLARVISESSSLSFERITRELRTANNIDLAGSTLGASPGKITLQTSDTDGYAQTITFALENGVVNVYENGVLSGRLTQANATTTALTFSLYTGVTSKAVQVNMTIQAVSGIQIRTESFQTSIEMRNSL